MRRWTFRTQSQTGDRQSAKAQCTLVTHEPAPFFLAMQVCTKYLKELPQALTEHGLNQPQHGAIGNWQTPPFAGLPQKSATKCYLQIARTSNSLGM